MADAYFSVETEVAAAEQSYARGDYHGAEGHLRRLISHTKAADYEYDAWIDRLADVYVRLGRRREAGYLHLYRHQFELARQTFAPDAHLERAIAFSLEGRHTESAPEFARAGALVQAAVSLESAKDNAGARSVWADLVDNPRLRDHPYERALVHTNLGLSTRRAGGDKADSQRHLAAAQRLLEQVADDFETAGERERAFDCYGVLLKLGQDSGSFENLSEGYLNCIRILKDDGLKFYVLQYHEDFLELALERREFHAAATLYREAAEYSMRAGLPYHRFYTRQSAETWLKEAQKGLEGGAPMDLVENSFLAAIEAFSTVGNFSKVREVYHRLAQLDLVDRKKVRYTAITERFKDAPSEDAEGLQFPQYLRQKRAYGDVWFVDLVEWEHDGDPEKVASTIVGDLKYPDGFRRQALRVILEIAFVRARTGQIDPDTLATVAQTLGQLQSYVALAPLEKLFEQGEDVRVRRAAVAALKHLFFKRSFGLLAKGLRDREDTVREAAIDAMRRLHFPHAFHPLTRIFREHTEQRVKEVALETIGRIESIEAGELLIGVLRQETGPLREVARKALAVFDDADIVPIMKQQLELEANPDVRKILEELVGRVRRR
jgi:hypothetical protein